MISYNVLLGIVIASLLGNVVWFLYARHLKKMIGLNDDGAFVIDKERSKNHHSVR